MIGALPAGAVIAASLGSADPRQKPNADQPFVWGKGGQRLTPESIARQREIAQSLMQPDFSPVGSVWEGLGRAVGNWTGALRERDLNKAEQRNMAYSQDRIAQLLTGGGIPSASAPPGSSQSSGLGGNSAALMQVIADPYADASVKSLAEMQLKQLQAREMKQFEYDNRELPEIVQLANLANDPAQPAHVRKAAEDRITALNDPLAVIPDLGGQGTYVGPRSGIAAALGAPADDAPDTLPPDFFDEPPPVSGAPAAATVMDQASFRALSQSLGSEQEALAFLKRNGLTVGGR